MKNTAAHPGGLCMSTSMLARRCAVAFNLTPQLAKFCTLLITHEFVTPQQIADEIGFVDARMLTYRLRKRLKIARPDIEVQNRAGVGFWIEPSVRHNLRTEFDTEAHHAA